MENKNKKKENKSKKIFAIIICIVVLLVAVFGATYGYWQLTKKQEDRNVIKTSCLDFTMGNADGYVKVENAWPMNVSEVLQTDDVYTFTVTNNCKEDLAYTINFESVTASGIKGYLSDYNVDMMIDNIFLGDYAYLESVTPDDQNARSAKKLLTTSVGGSESGNNTNTHNFRLWVNENAPVSEQGKGFAGKIYVQGGQNIELVASGDASRTEECDDLRRGISCDMVPVTGNNVTYKLYSDGTLNFEGTGEIMYEPISTIFQNIVSGLNLTSTEQQILTEYGYEIGLFIFNDVSDLAQFSEYAELANGFTSYNLAFFENLCELVSLDANLAPVIKGLYDKISKIVPKKFIINIMDGITSVPYHFSYGPGAEMSRARLYISSSVNELERESLGCLNIPDALFIPSTVTTFGYFFLQDARIGYLSIQPPIDQATWQDATYYLGDTTINTLRFSQNSTLTNLSKLTDIENEIDIYVPKSVTNVGIYDSDAVNLKFYGPERTVTGIGDAKSVTWNVN